MLHLPVVLAVDRAGLVGEDGETHHGVFDVGFLRQVPGMQILCPGCTDELKQMLSWAVTKNESPVALRYPRGGNRGAIAPAWDPERPVVVEKSGEKVAIVTYGILTANAQDAAEILNRHGIDAAVIRLTQIEPIPEAALVQTLARYQYVLIAEETSSGAGIGEALICALSARLPQCKFELLDLKKCYITHGSLKELYAHCGLDGKSISNHIQEVLKVEN